MADTVYIDYIASALVHDPLSVVVWPVDGADCHALSFQMLREGQTLVRASITFKKGTPRGCALRRLAKLCQSRRRQALVCMSF